jgi:hypothetical protein
MKTVEHNFIAFLFGFVVASCLALSIKYPLHIATLDKMKTYCPNSTMSIVWVGLSGDIFKVKCENGTQTEIHPDFNQQN